MALILTNGKKFNRVIVYRREATRKDALGRVCHSHMRCWMTDYNPNRPDDDGTPTERGQMFNAPLPENSEVDTWIESDQLLKRGRR